LSTLSGVLTLAALTGPLPKAGVVAVALLAVGAILFSDARSRGISMLGALALAPVLLLDDIWHSPQLSLVHRHPLLAAAVVGLGLCGLCRGARLLSHPPSLLPPLVALNSVVAQIVGLVMVRTAFDWSHAAPYLIGGVIGVPLGVAALAWAATAATGEKRDKQRADNGAAARRQQRKGRHGVNLTTLLLLRSVNQRLASGPVVIPHGELWGVGIGNSRMRCAVPRRAGEAFFASREIERGKYYLMTCHRRENVQEASSLEAILQVVSDARYPVFPPPSYRVQKVLLERGRALPRNAITFDPVGDDEFVALMVNARGVLTDSGTVVEETCVLHMKFETRVRCSASLDGRVGLT